MQKAIVKAMADAAVRQIKSMTLAITAGLSMSNGYNNCSYFDKILKRFPIDYRITTHCTTGESPAKLFLGRKLKTRFSLLKPPTVMEKISQKQKVRTTRAAVALNLEKAKV